MTQHKCTKLANGNVRTCEVRLSFPELFRAKAIEEGKAPKYSTALLFPKGADITVLKQACADAIKEKWGDKPPKGLRLPFRDQGEKEFAGYEEGAVFFNCSSERRPPVVNRKREEITDEEDVYPGVWALVTVRAFAFSSDGKKSGPGFKPGVAFGLQAVQIIKDGERLGGGTANPEEEFEELDDLISDGGSADEVFNDDNDPLASIGL